MNRLLRFLLLAVGPGEEDPNAPPPEPTGIDDSGSTGDDSFDDLLDLAEDGGGTPPPAGNEDNAAVSEARRRAETAERERDSERQRRESVEQQLRSLPVPRGDADYESEERELQQLGDQVRRGESTQEQYAWRKWQIDSNRNIRAGRRESQNALAASVDLADKAAFDRLELSKPKVYKAYAERVEQAMAEMHRRGQNAPRLAVLRLLIGDDIMSGKVKKSTKPKPIEQPTTRVARGASPGVRSDVRANSGAKTEHQKRIERLEGRPI